MRIDLKRLLVAALVIGLCVTCVVLFHRPRPLGRTSYHESLISPEPIQQTDLEQVTQAPEPLLLTPPGRTSYHGGTSYHESLISHSALATTIAPPEPPEDPDAAREWARKNPHDALVWMRNAPAGEKRDTVVEMACAQLAESDPARAVSLAEGYSGGCSNLLENLVHQWAEQNQPAATAYVISKPPGEERDRLLGRVAFTRSIENPFEAAQLVAESISPGEVQDEAAISVLHQWALRDPNAAFAWAASFPEGTVRDRALNEIANILSPPSDINSFRMTDHEEGLESP
jgi:hypothetical protein